MEWVWAGLASLCAGFVDAIVGGGGLILLPALFAVLPAAPPATVLGINKGSSIWGTAAATWQYTRRVQLPWASLWLAAAGALAGSGLGAWWVTQASPEVLRKLLPVALAAVFVYTLLRKDLGREHRPRLTPARERATLLLVGAVVGCYDGFFGPGTGSFLVFALVRLLGWDFLHASAAAKLLNTASNLAALSWFAWSGHVWWKVVAVTATANVVGSVLGARMAMRHGAGFVRVFFMLVVGALILRTAWQAYGG